MRALAQLLEEALRRERTQALFYRGLAGDAELAGDAAAAERLNELLADEQHHVSRITARLLELGVMPDEGRHAPPLPTLEGWERAARTREDDEVAWYEEALSEVEDAETKAILEEILASERHHRDEMRGKWMSASHEERKEGMP
ncbi:MAG: hypothetical protein PVJ02_12275 [Gemmatimonadota bacterium]|jgi:rubrerythrin